MSIKRKMVKRNKHNRARLNKLLNAGKRTLEEQEEDRRRKNELKKIRAK